MCGDPELSKPYPLFPPQCQRTLWSLGIKVLLRWAELLLSDLLKDESWVGVELTVGDSSWVGVKMESLSFQGPLVPKRIP